MVLRWHSVEIPCVVLDLVECPVFTLVTNNRHWKMWDWTMKLHLQRCWGGAFMITLAIMKKLNEVNDPQQGVEWLGPHKHHLHHECKHVNHRIARCGKWQRGSSSPKACTTTPSKNPKKYAQIARITGEIPTEVYVTYSWSIMKLQAGKSWFVCGLTMCYLSRFLISCFTLPVFFDLPQHEWTRPPKTTRKQSTHSQNICKSLVEPVVHNCLQYPCCTKASAWFISIEKGFNWLWLTIKLNFFWVVEIHKFFCFWWREMAVPTHYQTTKLEKLSTRKPSTTIINHLFDQINLGNNKDWNNPKLFLKLIDASYFTFNETISFQRHGWSQSTIDAVTKSWATLK